MNLGKKQNSSQKKNGNCVVLKSSKSQNLSPGRFLESQGVSGILNPHSDTRNEYDYTYIYDTEGRRMPPQVNQFTLGITERIELKLETPQYRNSKKESFSGPVKPHFEHRDIDHIPDSYSRQKTPTMREVRFPSPRITQQSMEELQRFKNAKDIVAENFMRDQMHEKILYSIKNAQLGGRLVLGHIHPLTLEFIEVCKQDGSLLFTEAHMNSYLTKKVLFAFIDEDDLQKMLILATNEQDLDKPHILAEKRLILGSMCPKTRKFIPDIYPGPGFYDWESFFNNKRAIYGNFNISSGQFESYFIESEHDYELSKTLSKKIGVLGHIDSVSRKFVPKKKGDDRVKFTAQKLANVAVSYLDEKYPEVQVVLAPLSLDNDLEQLIKSSVLVRGKIDRFHGYFTPGKQQNFTQANPILLGSDRLLKKDCVLGFIDPIAQKFIWKQEEKQSANQEDFFSHIICRKVLLAHIDPKFPQIGYILIEDLLDKEIQGKLSTIRAMLGHIDPASRRFIPDVSAIKDDTVLLKKLVKLRAILGYIDPLSLQFVKEQAPLNQGCLNETCLNAQKYVGVAHGIKVLLTFVDPHHASLAQIIVAGTSDHEVDSALLQKRAYIGEISPVTLKFIPDKFIEGIHNVTSLEALYHKMTALNYNIPKPGIKYLGTDPEKDLSLYTLDVSSLDDRNQKLQNSPSKYLALQQKQSPIVEDQDESLTSSKFENIEKRLIEELGDLGQPKVDDAEESFKLKVKPVPEPHPPIAQNVKRIGSSAKKNSTKVPTMNSKHNTTVKPITKQKKQIEQSHKVKEVLGSQNDSGKRRNVGNAINRDFKVSSGIRGTSKDSKDIFQESFEIRNISEKVMVVNQKLNVEGDKEVTKLADLNSQDHTKSSNTHSRILQNPISSMLLQKDFAGQKSLTLTGEENIPTKSIS